MLETDVNFSGEEEIPKVNQFYTSKSDKNEYNSWKISKLLTEEETLFIFRGNGNTQSNWIWAIYIIA